jgi:hypothetical protein
MLRKTIFAVVAVLAVGSAAFAPLSASASGRHGSSIHRNFVTSPCQAGPTPRFRRGSYAIASELLEIERAVFRRCPANRSYRTWFGTISTKQPAQA